MAKEQKVYKCNVEGCNAPEYKWRTSLNRHINNKHKNIRYMCENCGKTFTTIHQLTLHQKKCMPSQAETPAESETFPIETIYLSTDQEVFSGYTVYINN